MDEDDNEEDRVWESKVISLQDCYKECLNDILNILHNPPSRHSIPSRGGGRGPNPPDWREAARLIAAKAHAALGTEAKHPPVKFRRV